MDRKEEIIKDLAYALQEFMEVWDSGDATRESASARRRRVAMWDAAKRALDAAKKEGLLT